jgi:hypothetical protein
VLLLRQTQMLVTRKAHIMLTVTRPTTRKHLYSETNVMHFLLNLLRI